MTSKNTARIRMWIRRPMPSKLSRGVCSLARAPDVSTIECLELILMRKGAERGSRKEVIQPQVLLQLPCYDFTPITDHTLGGFLPCGLEHRLLVQPTFVM
jgi:hypothetical protein